jgi:hypothetical protein
MLKEKHHEQKKTENTNGVPDMVTNACKSYHSRDQGRKITSSRPAWATIEMPCLKKKKKKK